MATPKIVRKLATSKTGIRVALNTGLYRMNNPGPNGNILSAATSARLTAHTPLYEAAMVQVELKQGILFLNTRNKKQPLKDCRKAAGDFIKGVNLAVELGTLTVADRAYYGLSLETGKKPPMKKDLQVKTVCEKLISGEAARVAAGGGAMGTPNIGNVVANLAVLLPLLANEVTMKQDLDNAQEAVDALNPEAKKIIKKVWDEAETRYNEETPESKRANCRQWGVVYVSNIKTPVNITVRNQNGDLLPLSTGTPKQTGKAKKANAQGIIAILTNLTGEIIIVIKCPGYQDLEINVTIVPGEAQELAVQLHV